MKLLQQELVEEKIKSAQLELEVQKFRSIENSLREDKQRVIELEGLLIQVLSQQQQK